MGDRRVIEDRLRDGMSIGGIAVLLGKSWSMIAREIKTHRTDDTKKYVVSECKNLCVHRDTCRVTRLCRVECGNMRCAKCASGVCNEICPDYTYVGSCPKLERAPYVCNACKSRLNIMCRYSNVFYDSDWADEMARVESMRSRTGLDCSEEQVRDMVKLVKPLLKKGQSLQHIRAAHGDELPVSIRTFYRYIDMGILDICNLDLPKKVKYVQAAEEKA